MLTVVRQLDCALVVYLVLVLPTNLVLCVTTPLILMAPVHAKTVQIVRLATIQMVYAQLVMLAINFNLRVNHVLLALPAPIQQEEMNHVNNVTVPTVFQLTALVWPVNLVKD